MQLGGDVRYLSGVKTMGLSYHYSETNNSGTPALPMDIEYIKSNRFSLDGTFNVNHWQVEWLLGYMDADHGMTNFFMREKLNLAKYRRNDATASTTNFKLVLSQEYRFGELILGADGYIAKHDSVITNPNNTMFEVVNFNNVSDDRYALYGEWQYSYAQTDLQLGLRFKRAEANPGKVKTSMAMMPNMMGVLAKELLLNFNQENRNVADNNVDIALSSQTQLTQQWSLYAGVGIKNRAPSYQERYLWTPMESTGGLADGHTYIGNINLASETAYQMDLGLTYQSKTIMVTPHVFYQNIDNYIQGTPLAMTDMSAKMLAKMMSNDDAALKFNNVDAKLYGMDMNGYYTINSQFKLSSIISYVIGQRRDIDDNLYRIAPLNEQITLTYSTDELITNLTLLAVSAQNNVSLTNSEQITSGYGVINIDMQYFVNNSLSVRTGIDNFLDREYQNHLGGYNRVKGNDITLMSRLPSEGLSAWLDVIYSF